MPIEYATPRKKGQRTKPDTNIISTVGLFNQYSTYPSHGLNPRKLTDIIKEADQGDIFRQSELMEEILEKDGRIGGLFQSRRLGVLRSDYEITPVDDTPEEQEIVEFVRNVINNCDKWRQAKSDMLDAVAKGFSAHWIEWQTIPDTKNTVVFKKLHWTHNKNFRFGKASDPKHDLNEIRRLTDANMMDGVDLEPYKWLVPIIKARSGHPSRAAIMRTCFWPYLFKNFGLKSFVQFCEIYGIPLRVGKYQAGAGTPEIEALRNALKGISTDAAALISELTSIEFPEVTQKSATGELYERLINLLNREVSQAVLGHTGTIESTAGRLGGEDAAQEVRWDLLASDAADLDDAISDQLIKPLVVFNYGPREKYPSHKTKVEQPKNLKEMVEVDESLQRMGWTFTEEYITQTYGRPAAKDGDKILEPRQPQVMPFDQAVAKGLLGKKGELLR